MIETRFIPKRGAALALLLVAGCLPVDKPGVDGQLGSTAFFYVCSDSSDPACDDQISTVPFEKLPLVAVGATFDIRLDATDETATSPTPFLEEVSTGPGYTRFRAIKPGFAVIMSQGTSTASDFTHIRLATPTGVALLRDPNGTGSYQKFDPTGGITLPVGTEVLRIVSVTADGTELAGAIPVSWKSSDAKVVSIDTDPSDDKVTIDGLVAGKATLTVTLGDAKQTIDVTVTGVP